MSASIARDRSLFESRSTWNDAVYLVVRLREFIFSRKANDSEAKNFKRIRNEFLSRKTSKELN